MNKASIFILITVSMSVNAINSTLTYQQVFKEFIKQYNKTYASNQEKSFRFQVWLKNYIRKLKNGIMKRQKVPIHSILE
jgi:hypothetical protein